MSYSGFLSDPDYTRRSRDEQVSGDWRFSGNITFDNTILGSAMAAFYGDIAEYYQVDITETIPQGSLVKFGGKFEIKKTAPNDREYFGIISTNPGVELNAKEENSLPVALVGRVPCRVVGKIKKFDKLTTSYINGVAKRQTFMDILLRKPVIGIALESSDNENEKLVKIFMKIHL